jgi:predicted chitinase
MIMAASKEVKDERYKIIRSQLAESGLNPQQQAYLLGQIKKETGSFSSLAERWNGDRNTYFENKYGHTTSKGKELGNTSKGDGEKYRGRGYIQITGKSNYAKYNDALYPEEVNLPIDQKTLVKFPEKLEDPVLGGKASLAYIADRAGDFSTPDDLTRAINGGLFSAARSRDPVKKRTALADIQERRQYAAEYLNMFDKEGQQEAQRQLTTEALGDWNETNPVFPSARTTYAQQDPRRVDSASQMAQAPTEYSSMEDLLMDRNLLGGGRL